VDFDGSGLDPRTFAVVTATLAIVLLLVAVGCNWGRGGAPETALRLAMFPSTDSGKIVSDSQPLVKYLKKETGARIELVVPTNYDLKGHSFAFGDVNSTSGHLMPAYYKRAANVDPGILAKALYTGGHDATALVA
jgi:ABC-type phosphate/phosphonate transport system substrate-binding protein